ncbi:MAG TPA: CHAD domain-containing protein [Candidatus Acidoferrum sp.]|nr:CHAD domain-containing protein [Candidatus Acidoferrum sp.]
MSLLPSPLAVASPASARTPHRSLSHWMNRVLEELHSLPSSNDPDAVHDLRVALRRCRSLAAVMEEVDPDPTWPSMRKVARRLFRSLGELRDAQVMAGLVRKLGPENDPLRAQLLPSLQAEEKQLSESALRVAAKFDVKVWSGLERQLRRRVRIIPVGGLAAECLALERFEHAKELHNRALRTEKPKPWHAARIGLKRFRYILEGLLPDHYAAWSENLKRLQDLLGDIHDLDVLAELLAEKKGSQPSASTKAWLEKIVQQRRERIETYRQLTLGKTSLWHEWRHNLPHGKRLEAAAASRLRATARATDGHLRRSSQISRIALRLFELMRRSHPAPAFDAPSLRRIMEAAAMLHGIDSVGGRRLSHKALRKFLLGLPIPPNWTPAEWDLMTWAVRFHRGAEPRQKNGFAKLSEEHQACVRVVAGILRIARALRKSGIDRPVGLRCEKSEDAFVLQVPGLADTAETAARLAAAKHLLETVLAKPLLLKSIPKPAKAAEPTEPPQEPLPLTAAASA